MYSHPAAESHQLQRSSHWLRIGWGLDKGRSSGCRGCCGETKHSLVCCRLTSRKLELLLSILSRKPHESRGLLGLGFLINRTRRRWKSSWDLLHSGILWSEVFWVNCGYTKQTKTKNHGEQWNRNTLPWSALEKINWKGRQGKTQKYSYLIQKVKYLSLREVICIKHPHSKCSQVVSVTEMTRQVFHVKSDRIPSSHTHTRSSPSLASQ